MLRSASSAARRAAASTHAVATPATPAQACVLFSTDSGSSSDKGRLSPQQKQARQQQQQQRQRQHAQKQYAPKPVGNASQATPTPSASASAAFTAATPVAPAARATATNVSAHASAEPTRRPLPLQRPRATNVAPEPSPVAVPVPSSAASPLPTPPSVKPVAAAEVPHASAVPTGDDASMKAEEAREAAEQADQAKIAQAQAQAAAAPAAAAPAPKAATATATPAAAGGSGGARVVSGGTAAAAGAAQPTKKKGSFLRTLLFLLGGGAAGTLALLKYNEDARDYSDIHLTAEMARLRAALPSGFLPAPSNRALMGRVAVGVGLLETPDQDLDHAVQAVSQQVVSVQTTLDHAVQGANAVISTQLAKSQEKIDESVEQLQEQVERTVVEPVRHAVEHAIEDNIKPALRNVSHVVMGEEPKIEEQAQLAKEQQQAKAAAALGSSAAAAPTTGAFTGMRAAATRSDVPAHQLAEYDSLMQQLAEAETELASYAADQQAQLLTELARTESALKERLGARLSSLEADQLHTVEVMSQRQMRRLVRAHDRAMAPWRHEFERHLSVEEENKWRKKLYDAMYEQNEALSAVADQAIVAIETKLESSFDTEIKRLTRAAEDIERDTVQPLQADLEAHRHRELRSAQAHRLSAALLELQMLVDKDQVSLAEPWKVVREVAQSDYTLRQAIAGVDESSVTRGVYSLKVLKDVFANVLAPELKVATFMPDEPAQASVLSMVFARLFAAATVNEAGAVVLAPPTFATTSAARAAAPSLAAARRESEASHQAADYAHYINASTFLASNAPELALRELELLHPSRQSEQLKAFIRELRRAVQVHKAVDCVKMRVLAINAAPK